MLNDLINRPYIVTLTRIMAQNRGTLRFVGGCVRDALLNKKINDIDMVIDLFPNQVMKILTDHNIKCIPTGLKHGTVTAVISNNVIEITTLRRDIICDGRHAIIEFTNNWQQDAARRDFTFNALYCDMEGKIYDYFGGLDDLRNKKLKFVGNIEKRISEDYLRILRAFRFYVQINCKPLSEEITSMCRKYAHKIQSLSGERIQREILSLLKFELAIEALILMERSNLLYEVMPIFLDIASMHGVRFYCDDPLVNLAFILRANKSENICKRLYTKWRLSKKQYHKLYNLYSTELSIDKNKQKSNLQKLGKELYCNMLIIYHYEGKIDNDMLLLNNSIADTWEIIAFPFNGSDLIEIGYIEGPKLGYYLHKVRKHWAEQNYLLDKKSLIRYAKSLNK